MPKLKRNKSVAKRVKITAHGKIRIAKAGRRHLLSGKTGNKKRRLRKTSFLGWGQTRLAKRSLR